MLKRTTYDYNFSNNYLERREILKRVSELNLLSNYFDSLTLGEEDVVLIVNFESESLANAQKRRI